MQEKKISRLKSSQELLHYVVIVSSELLTKRFNRCGERTLCRDLSALRKNGVIVPLRSTIKDMGRSISHRRLIVKHYLAGKEYAAIARSTCRSIAAVQNYIEKFKRTVALMHEGYDLHSISFLVRISPELVKQYRSVYNSAKIIAFRHKELKGFLKKEHRTAHTGRRKR